MNLITGRRVGPRSQINATNVTDGWICVLTAVLATVVVVVVADVVVRTGSGDVTEPEVDKRLDKHTGCKTERLKMLSRALSDYCVVYSSLSTIE